MLFKSLVNDCDSLKNGLQFWKHKKLSRLNLFPNPPVFWIWWGDSQLVVTWYAGNTFFWEACKRFWWFWLNGMSFYCFIGNSPFNQKNSIKTSRDCLHCCPLQLANLCLEIDNWFIRDNGCWNRPKIDKLSLQIKEHTKNNNYTLELKWYLKRCHPNDAILREK